MPIEIRELLIRVTVNQPEQASAEANPVTGQTSEDKDKDAAITQCVEEMLRIMHDEKER
jgi:hypothetical protein